MHRARFDRYDVGFLGGVVAGLLCSSGLYIEAFGAAVLAGVFVGAFEEPRQGRTHQGGSR